MKRDPALCRRFVREARALLSQFPQIEHDWSIDADEDHCILDILPDAEGGFPITVEVYPDEITIRAGGAHTTLSRDGATDELVDDSLGLLRDLLSPAMRIRECLAGGAPYRWAFEVFQDGRWMTEESVGLFFYNYFGTKTERTFQNQILPARQNPVEPGDRCEPPKEPSFRSGAGGGSPPP